MELFVGVSRFNDRIGRRRFLFLSGQPQGASYERKGRGGQSGTAQTAQPRERAERGQSHPA